MTLSTAVSAPSLMVSLAAITSSANFSFNPASEAGGCGDGSASPDCSDVSDDGLGLPSISVNSFDTEASHDCTSGGCRTHEPRVAGFVPNSPACCSLRRNLRGLDGVIEWFVQIASRSHGYVSDVADAATAKSHIGVCHCMMERSNRLRRMI
ncbi:hypothetical protein [Rhizobium sp. 2TAF27]|uniref:hypothetical protein n=1 Tax=Rhizobium sp. 2TAF27 TaxID=3233013 RepID=UPI003F9672DD